MGRAAAERGERGDFADFAGAGGVFEHRPTRTTAPAERDAEQIARRVRDQIRCREHAGGQRKTVQRRQSVGGGRVFEHRAIAVGPALGGGAEHVSGGIDDQIGQRAAAGCAVKAGQGGGLMGGDVVFDQLGAADDIDIARRIHRQRGGDRPGQGAEPIQRAGGFLIFEQRSSVGRAEQIALAVGNQPADRPGAGALVKACQVDHLPGGFLILVDRTLAVEPAQGRGAVDIALRVGHHRPIGVGGHRIGQAAEHGQ